MAERAVGGPRRFLHGTTYYHFAHPADGHAAQFARMRELGLNAVRVAEIWPGWEVLEPRPGAFDFAELDAYVGQAHAAGLQVVMGVGINNPPPWVFMSFPGVRCVDVSGAVAQRRVQSANHDHPAYREAMARFIEVLARRYAGHPAVTAWQVGNEVRYGVPRPDNACTRERFRGWLRDRCGGDLAGLNGAWGTVYGDWSELYPYLSAAGAPTEGLTPLLLATARFYQWSLEELVAWGAAIVRRFSDRPVFHNNHGISGNGYSHWRMAAACDWAVQDLYPTMGDRPRDAVTLGLDLGQSVAAATGRPYVIGELGIAQYGTFRRNRPPPALCEAVLMELLAAGARGILYFPHAAPRFEQPHKFTGSQAVLRRDGSPNAYAAAVRSAAQFLERHEERLLAAAPVEPAIAAYYPEESLALGGEAGFASVQRAALNGTSALFGRLGLPLRWLDTERLAAADLSRFRMIWLPVAYLLPRAVGAALRRYVEGGGLLAAECRPGYVDELGWLYAEQPGAGLHEVFGAREDLFWEEPVHRVDVRVGGETVAAAFPLLAQSYRPCGGEVCGTNERGECVAVEQRFGRGRAILFGFAPSLAFGMGGDKYAAAAEGVGGGAQDQAAAVRLGALLAAAAGVARPAAWDCEAASLNARYLREPDGRTLVFLANHGEPAPVSLPAGSEVLELRGCRGEGDRRVIEPYGWLWASAPGA